MSKDSKNLELWLRQEETDPSVVKKINIRGGFSAVDAYSQFKRATEEFGPFGIGWGLNDLRYNIIPNSSGEPIMVTLQAEFFYKYNDCTGIFDVATDIAFKVGDDIFKKLRTDCLTKALSMVGFNADVFLGKFDDNKYVAEMTKKYATTESTDPATKSTTKPDTTKADTEKVLRLIYDEYMEIVPDGKVVDMKILKDAIKAAFGGKLPTKAASVGKVLEKIDVNDVVKDNDFTNDVKGLE